jgi:hypothetical protein
MTDEQKNPAGWPGAPGVPENRFEHGLHWLWRADTGWALHRWNADERQYYGRGDVFGPDWAGRRWTYGGVVLTPAEVAARVAEARADARADGMRAGMREARSILQHATGRWPHVGPVPPGIRGEWALRDRVLPLLDAAAILAAMEKEPTT